MYSHMHPNSHPNTPSKRRRRRTLLVQLLLPAHLLVHAPPLLLPLQQQLEHARAEQDRAHDDERLVHVLRRARGVARLQRVLHQDEHHPKEVRPIPPPNQRVRRTATNRRGDSQCPQQRGAPVRVARELARELERDGERRDGDDADERHDPEQRALVVRLDDPREAEPQRARGGHEDLGHEREVVREDVVEYGGRDDGGTEADEEQYRAQRAGS